MTTANPCGVRSADHTTPSAAAIAFMPSGMTNAFEPFGDPGRYGSAASRLYIRSTPPSREKPGLGESNPSEIVGARPFHTGSGHTQSPGNVVGRSVACGALRERDHR